MQIRGLHAQGKVDDMIYTLSRTPDHRVRVSNRCFINGFFFRTREVEKNLSTHNSGVVVKGDDMEWYGLIKNIITLDFPNGKEVMLFECDWFDVPGGTTNKSRGYNKDKYGIVDIDTTRFRFSDEPYILATQAEQVCYVKHAKKTNWCTVLRMKPRNLFAMPEGEDTENEVGDTDVDSIVVGVEQMSVEHPDEDLTNWSRNDVEGQSGDALVIEEARAAAIPEPDEIPDEDDDCDDTYTNDGVFPASEEDDDDFFV